MEKAVVISEESRRSPSAPAHVRNDTEGECARRLRTQANMLAIVAHELRHPMFRIALAADLATALGGGDPAAVARSLDDIRETVAIMKRLVEDLDDYGSLQSGRLRVMCCPMRPAAIVDSALAAFAPVAAKLGIKLSSRIADTLQDILGDRERLLQVVGNLVSNAMCLTPTGGVIEISVERDVGCARFAVSDSGPGVDPADLPHLFERYWRGKHDCYAGRGLGLAIARDLVESHGGQIWAENLSTGGARFSFTIRTTPVAADGSGFPAGTPAPADG